MPKDIHIWAALIQQNYPRDAAGAMLEGSARLRAIVNPEGRVVECVILKSSGHALLDKTACDGMLRYAVFIPATDASGSPTIGAYSTMITYRDTGAVAPVPPSDEAPGGGAD